MKKLLALILITASFAGIVWLIIYSNDTPSPSEKTVQKEIKKPLEKYSIENLSKTEISPGVFTIESQIKREADYTSNVFVFKFDPDLAGNLKNTTGQINIPNKNGYFPLVIMLRGYVDQELYKTGDGTRSAAAFFAKNGFITVAPDFLGYAQSDKEADNIFESRFQTYTTTLSLIESLNQINNWDKENSFIWGHSNGGQIALTILEITKDKFPTVLWAPVSKSFPYSILYYTDESIDRGKLIRRELAEFEKLYDTDDHSLTEYFENINAPIQIHQGGSDDAVPIEWSNSLAAMLLSLEKEITYHKHPGADHNMRPSWDTVVAKDLEFFRQHLTTD